MGFLPCREHVRGRRGVKAIWAKPQNGLSFSATREVTQGTFRFTVASGGALTQSEVTVPLTDAARAWFGDAASTAFGSQFTLTMAGGDVAGGGLEFPGCACAVGVRCTGTGHSVHAPDLGLEREAWPCQLGDFTPAGIRRVRLGVRSGRQECLRSFTVAVQCRLTAGRTKISRVRLGARSGREVHIRSLTVAARSRSNAAIGSGSHSVRWESLGRAKALHKPKEIAWPGRLEAYNRKPIVEGRSKMPERAIVIAELERHGTKLQELNQRARREAYVAPGQGVDQGFCTGFCFDWIRKVILGGENRATYVPKATKTAEQKVDTERRQTLRAATVHVKKTAYRDNDVANFGNARTDVNNLGSLIDTLRANYNPNRDQANLRIRFGPETMRVRVGVRHAVDSHHPGSNQRA